HDETRQSCCLADSGHHCPGEGKSSPNKGYDKEQYARRAEYSGEFYHRSPLPLQARSNGDRGFLSSKSRSIALWTRVPRAVCRVHSNGSCFWAAKPASQARAS